MATTLIEEDPNLPILLASFLCHALKVCRKHCNFASVVCAPCAHANGVAFDQLESQDERHETDTLFQDSLVVEGRG